MRSVSSKASVIAGEAPRLSNFTYPEDHQLAGDFDLGSYLRELKRVKKKLDKEKDPEQKKV